MQPAIRRDFVAIRISALQFFEVSVVCPRGDLEVTFRANPDSRRYPSKPERAAGRAPTLLVQSPVDFAISLADGGSEFDSEAFQRGRAAPAASFTDHATWRSSPSILPAPLLL